MEREEMRFKVDYRGWIDRTRRTFNDVQSIFKSSNNRENFAAWADNAKFGEKINISGVNIELVPSDYEISQRCRYFINF